MSLYSSKSSEVKDVGSSWQPGPFKFKVIESSLHSGGNIMFKMQTWTEDNQDGPKITEWLNITSSNDNALAEVDRRLTTLLGKTSIDDPKELVGKAGYVVLRKGEKYLEAMPFGGFYTADRKSATGKESMSDRIKQAIEYTVAPVATVEDESGDQPF